MSKKPKRDFYEEHRRRTNLQAYVTMGMFALLAIVLTTIIAIDVIHNTRIEP